MTEEQSQSDSETSEKKGKPPSNQKKKKTLKERIFGTIPWRRNVLALVAMGYVAILIVFLTLAFFGCMAAETAYDVVKGPLMALIGGSLALSKDLVDNVVGSSNNDADPDN